MVLILSANAKKYTFDAKPAFCIFVSMTFSGRFLLNIIHFANRQGVPIADLLQLSGMSADELCREEKRVSAEVYNSVLTTAMNHSGDPYFGLHLGESLNLTAAGLIAQISQTSRTIKEALYYCCEFASLGCQALPLTLEEKRDHIALVMTPDPMWEKKVPQVVRHTVEGTLTFFIREFQTLTHQKQRPIAIHLPYQSPNDQQEYERVWNCPIQFGQTQISILLDKQQVAAPIITSDFNLLRILVQLAEERVGTIAQQQGYFELVRKSMLYLIKPEFPTIEQVAANLNVSTRTLQRKLKEEGHTYTQLLEELRKDFAFQYLKKPELSINEVAHLLSYSDPSSFIRSFKRWTGKTPKSWRLFV